MDNALSIDELDLLGAIVSHPVQIVRETWRWTAAWRLHQLGFAKVDSANAHVEITERGRAEAKKLNITKE